MLHPREQPNTDSNMDEIKLFERLDKLEEKIDQKFDKVIETANHQEVHLGKLTVSVEDHIQRTNILQDEQKEIKKTIVPIQKHVSMVNGALKLIGLGGIIATIVMAVVESAEFILRYLHH